MVRPLVRQDGWDSVEDRLYAAVILKSPGTVVLTSGAAAQSFALPAGLSQVSMPFTTGSQSVRLERGGATVTSATSATRIISSPTLFNYNVETAYSKK